ncbi:MAG: hypothetical protein KBT33_06595 [Prevotellaceae bacterium]|nr:hypothetical protein [Candidatus Minthosoma equi]
MKAIGGYFELADREAEGSYPVDGVRLNTSRNALEYIIRCLPDCKHVYLPLYTCEAVIEPFKRLPDVGFSFYHINNKFEIADEITLHDGEYLIANNYFGLKDAYIAKLSEQYGVRLIVDNAQALFAPVLPNIKAAYSARKYVGVADGGFAVGVSDLDALSYELDDASEHDSHLLIRKEQGAEAGFKDYQQNECKLDNQPIRRMAYQTQDILTHISYENVIAKRRANFEYLHQALGGHNQLVLPKLNSFACPMVYPFVGLANIDLRSKLIANKIFVARYWPNVLDWAKPDDLEYTLAIRFMPLPIDQRYGTEDMKRIIEIINNTSE